MDNNSDALVSGAGDYGYTDYEAEQFNSRSECLITSGTTRLFLLRNCSEYMVSTKMDVDLKPGASTVNQKE